MTKKLTVLQILPYLKLGGVERGTLEVAKHLTSEGHKALVVSGGGRMVKQLEQEGSRHFELPVGKKSLLTFRHAKTLRKIIIKNKVDVVHVRSRLPAWVNKLALHGIPTSQRPRLVSTVHGAYSVNAYSKVMLKSDRIIAVSDYIKSYILNNYPDTDEKKISVISRGIDPEQFPRNFAPSSKWLETWYKENTSIKDKILLCLPGRITRLKGHHDFIKLNAFLKKHSTKNFHALIVGGYDDRKKAYYDELLARIKKEDLQNDISFLGARDDLREIMAISNIVYSLSNKPESFGRTSLEALSLGRPVIAYDHGGATEVLSELFPQGLIPKNNIDCAIKKTVEITEHFDSINLNEKFTLGNMLDKILAIYESTSQE